MKTIFGIIFAVLIIAGLVKYGNKNEYEITQEFQKKYPERSFAGVSVDSRHFRIETIDGHEYVVYTYWGKPGGITHHEGCPNH